MVQPLRNNNIRRKQIQLSSKKKTAKISILLRIRANKVPNRPDQHDDKTVRLRPEFLKREPTIRGPGVPFQKGL